MRRTDNITTDGKETVGNVAQVQPGYLSREGVRHALGGTHYLVQAKDVSLNHGIRMDQVILFKPVRKPELYQVSRGDILLLARGQTHHACLVADVPSNTLASSVFYIIRPRAALVRPGYLAWWLNQPELQAEINASSRGTDIGYISRQAVEQLPVVVPVLEIQERIARIAVLREQEKLLLTRLDQKREQLIDEICRQAVRRTQEH